MSLRGQWIARYSGSNNGTAVLDLDEFDDHFAGIAFAWDDNPAYPNSMVRIRTESKSNSQHLKSIPVNPIDRAGNVVSGEVIKQLAAKSITMPETADIDLQLTGNALSINWTTPIGTAGTAVATSKTRDGVPSDLNPTAKGWDRFKKIINALEPKRYIYRGQENSTWRLRTSFHRTGRGRP